VDLSIGYTLKGPLSQLGRPALVHGLASRMIAEFSSNLDRRLSRRPGATNTRSADLNALSLLLAAMRAYVARMFARNNQRSG
jgi:carbon-monoxide dehydrogenase small subunit